MIVLDRVSCDCCGDDMGQLLGGEPVRSGWLVDQAKAPNFAVCPDCHADAAAYLGLPVPIPGHLAPGRDLAPGRNGTEQEAA